MNLRHAIRRLSSAVVLLLIANRQSVLAWFGLAMIGIGAWMIYPPAGLLAAGLLLFLDAAGWMERKT